MITETTITFFKYSICYMYVLRLGSFKNIFILQYDFYFLNGEKDIQTVSISH